MCKEHLFQQELNSLTKQQVLQRLWCRWKSHSDPDYDWVYDKYGGDVTQDVSYALKTYSDDPDCMFIVGYMANVVEWPFMDYFQLDVPEIEVLGKEMMFKASVETDNPLYGVFISRGSKYYSDLASLALANLPEYVPIEDVDVVGYFERMIRNYT